MPNRDGTGPAGRGPMTGRGFGFCGNRFYGSRNCYGRGFGRNGFGARFDGTNASEKEFLQNQKEFLKLQIEQINEELKSFED